MYFFILLLFIPTAILAIPTSLHPRKDLPTCPDNFYPSEQAYSDATTTACAQMYKNFGSSGTIPLDQHGAYANVDMALYQPNGPTKSSSFQWQIDVLNGGWPGQRITEAQCKDYFIGQTSIQEQYDHLCMAQGTQDVVLVKGWSYAVRKEGYATATFRFLPGKYSHKPAEQ